jgi:hypothetical protein
MRYRIQGTLELFVEMLNEQDAIHDSAFARKGIVSLRQTTYYDLHRQYGLDSRISFSPAQILDIDQKLACIQRYRENLRQTSWQNQRNSL